MPGAVRSGAERRLGRGEDGPVDLLGAIIDRITGVHPLPSPTWVALTGVMALALVAIGPLWRPTRMLVTIAHEAGHALVARLVGRRLQGIRLHHDTSGLTVTRGRPTGPGMVATLLAGYPAPALVGVGVAAVLGTGRSTLVLWVFLATLALMLLAIRNLYGLGVLLVVGAALAAATWYLPVLWQARLAYLLCWVLLFGAVRPTLELVGHRDRRSDPAQLARLSHLPAALWTALFVLVALAGAAAGTWLLLSPLDLPLGSTP